MARPRAATRRGRRAQPSLRAGRRLGRHRERRDDRRPSAAHGLALPHKPDQDGDERPPPPRQAAAARRHRVRPAPRLAGRLLLARLLLAPQRNCGTCCFARQGRRGALAADGASRPVGVARRGREAERDGAALRGPAAAATPRAPVRADLPRRRLRAGPCPRAGAAGGAGGARRGCGYHHALGQGARGPVRHVSLARRLRRLRGGERGAELPPRPAPLPRPRALLLPARRRRPLGQRLVHRPPSARRVLVPLPLAPPAARPRSPGCLGGRGPPEKRDAWAGGARGGTRSGRGSRGFYTQV